MPPKRSALSPGLPQARPAPGGMARALPVRDRSGRQRQGSGRLTPAGPTSARQTAAVLILARSGEQRAPPTRLDGRFWLLVGAIPLADLVLQEALTIVVKKPGLRRGLALYASDQVASPMTRCWCRQPICSPASAVGSGAGVDWPGRRGRGLPEGEVGRTSGGKGDSFSAGALTGPRAGPENHAPRRRFSAGNPLEMRESFDKARRLF